MRDEIVETMRKALTTVYGAPAYTPEALSAIRHLEAAGLRIIQRDATEAMAKALVECTGNGDDMWQAAFDAAPLYGEVGE